MLRPTRAIAVLPQALALALLTTPATAQSADDVTALIRSLAPIADQQLAAERPLVTAEIKGATVLLAPATSVDLEVYFDLNSAKLTKRSRGDLAALGAALSSTALRPYSYLIAGHTDASGAAAHNQQLSERRAESVRQFLITQYPIDPARLFVVGWGETRLKAAQTPNAAVNRRVEITLIVPEGGFAPAPAAPDKTTSDQPVTEQPPGSGGAVGAEVPLGQSGGGLVSATQPDQANAPSDAAEERCATNPAFAASDPACRPPGVLPGTLQQDEQGNVTIKW